MSEDFGFRKCVSLRKLVAQDRVMVVFPKDALSKEVVYKSATVLRPRGEFDHGALVEMDSGGRLAITTPRSLLIQRKRKQR